MHQLEQFSRIHKWNQFEFLQDSSLSIIFVEVIMMNTEYDNI